MNATSTLVATLTAADEDLDAALAAAEEEYDETLDAIPIYRLLLKWYADVRPVPAAAEWAEANLSPLFETIPECPEAKATFESAETAAWVAYGKRCAAALKAFTDK